MKKYIAFLRGINVGGNTRLPMAKLTSLCTGIGFKNVRTCIQSGNVIFESELTEEILIKKLEQALLASEQKHIPVIIRSEKELESVISCNPFPDAEPAQVGIMFFVNPVPDNLLTGVPVPGPEEVKIHGREIYIHYPNGMGRSKLKLPTMDQEGTVRNINTVTRLAGLDLRNKQRDKK
nr:DUF1697 domain-containing protein [uncultured Methanoregula sp.]